MRANFYSAFSKLWIVALLFSTLSFAVGCDDDDPLSPPEDHFEAVGLQIVQSGNVIFSYYGPDYAPGTTLTDDTIKISQGLSDHWDVKFYDEDSLVIDPPDDADKSFSAVFSDPTVAELWWHEGEEGEFEFHMKGLKEGFTTVEFKVLHNDHADFTTLPIPVMVDTNVNHGPPVEVKLNDEDSGDLLATSYEMTSSSEPTDTISVTNGETTDHIVAYFFDANDIKFQPGVPPHSLEVTSSNTAIADITGQEPGEPWAFKIEGKSEGTTEITVKILHDGSLGKEFKPISVKVTPTP